MTFISTPCGDIYNVGRIGGVKAVESGWLLFGNGPDEILEYDEVPEPVAVAWRDALVKLLSDYRPGRPLKQLDWFAIAATVDKPWAESKGWIAPDAPVAGE